MDISRITSGYPMAYKAKSAINNKFGTENQEAAGGEKSVFRWLYSADGSTGEVYRTQDYTLEHPVYRIKSRDAAGNLTEQMVDVSQVDPKNCNTYEMYAYAADLKETGKGSFEETMLHTVSARAAAGAKQNALASWDYSKNIDWTKAAEELMQSAYACGDLKGCWEWKKFLGFLSVKQKCAQPFFGTAMTREELLQAVDAQLEKNKKLYGKTEADWIKEHCPNWRTARFQFVGEDKTYSYFEWIEEWGKRHPEQKK